MGHGQTQPSGMHFARSPNAAAWLQELQNVNNEVKQSGCTRSKSTHDICSLKDMKTAPGVMITLPYLDLCAMGKNRNKIMAELRLREKSRRFGSEDFVLYTLYKLLHVPASNFLTNLQVTNLFISSNSYAKLIITV